MPSFLPSPLYIISHPLQAHPSSPHTHDTFHPQALAPAVTRVHPNRHCYPQFHPGPAYTPRDIPYLLILIILANLENPPCSRI
ncbi:hypothetical protein L873DRAFT_398156 [Choiromyces venosus 120613-1]|uniref:Uncharacterized protein n=1 Tax=Choiromyces venosus 120613-1 TaxID=1336337 RepID=A0A3N4J9Y1_9PEZI|nr:hypothetical protein L873DRAFT_398156 [Choiromyces venosus 120613-1]